MTPALTVWLLSLGQSMTLPEWLPPELGDIGRYGEPRFSLARPNSVAIVRKSDRARIVLQLEAVPSNQDPDTRKPMVVEQTAAPSGRPFGLRCWFSRDHTSSGVRSLVITSVNKLEMVQVSIFAARLAERPDRQYQQLDVAKDSVFVERLARTALSRFAGRRATAFSSTTINGKTVSSFLASGTQTRYLDLHEWATARQMAISTGTTEAENSFGRAGNTVLIPWGGVDLKIGATWRKMADVLMILNGRPFVPEAELEGV